MTEDREILECLDAHEGACRGPVEYRHAMSPTGVSYPRCRRHYDQRVAYQKKIVSRYGGRMYY